MSKGKKQIFLATFLFFTLPLFSMHESEPGKKNYKEIISRRLQEGPWPTKKDWDEADRWLDHFNSEEAEIDRIHVSLEKLKSLPYHSDSSVKNFVEQLKKREVFLRALIQGTEQRPPHYNAYEQGRLQGGHAEHFIENQKIIEQDIKEWVKDEVRKIDLDDYFHQQSDLFACRLIASRATLNNILNNPEEAPSTKQYKLIEALEASRALRESAASYREKLELAEHISLAKEANSPEFARSMLSDLQSLLLRVERFDYESESTEVKKRLQQAVQDFVAVVDKKYCLSYEALEAYAHLKANINGWLREKGTHYLSTEAWLKDRTFYDRTPEVEDSSARKRHVLEAAEKRASESK